MATIKFDDSEWKEVKIGEYDDRIMSVQEAEEAAYLENALLPCPFCGGSPKVKIQKQQYGDHPRACGEKLFWLEWE